MGSSFGNVSRKAAGLVAAAGLAVWGLAGNGPVAHLTEATNAAYADAGVLNYGDAAFSGAPTNLSLSAPVVGMAADPVNSGTANSGYWLVAADGGVFSYGDAPFYGSAGSINLYAPIIGMAATPHGDGYWLIASDGGVFSFGNALFYGSMGGHRLNSPIVGMASTPDGRGCRPCCE